jgi:hypothetical protein
MGIILPGFLLFGWMRDLGTVVDVDTISAIAPEISDSISLKESKSSKPVLIFGNRTGGYDSEPGIREKRNFVEKVEEILRSNI